MDPNTALISALVVGVTALSGVLLKFLHSARSDVKTCFGITFRTPDNTEQTTTPRKNTENVELKNFTIVPTVPVYEQNYEIVNNPK